MTEQEKIEQAEEIKTRKIAYLNRLKQFPGSLTLPRTVSPEIKQYWSSLTQFDYVSVGAQNIFVDSDGNDLIPTSQLGWHPSTENAFLLNDVNTQNEYEKYFDVQKVSVQNYKIKDFIVSSDTYTAVYPMVYDDYLHSWYAANFYAYVDELPLIGQEGMMYRVKSRYEGQGYEYYLYNNGEYKSLLGEQLQSVAMYTEEVDIEPVSHFSAGILMNPNTRRCFYEDRFSGNAILQKLNMMLLFVLLKVSVLVILHFNLFFTRLQLTGHLKDLFITQKDALVKNGKQSIDMQQVETH